MVSPRKLKRYRTLIRHVRASVHDEKYVTNRRKALEGEIEYYEATRMEYNGGKPVQKLGKKRVTKLQRSCM